MLEFACVSDSTRQPCRTTGYEAISARILGGVQSTAQIISDGADPRRVMDAAIVSHPTNNPVCFYCSPALARRFEVVNFSLLFCCHIILTEMKLLFYHSLDILPLVPGAAGRIDPRQCPIREHPGSTRAW